MKGKMYRSPQRILGRLADYQAVIVDLDGTLYYQMPVRMAMLKEMALHFWKLRDFLVIKKYRKLYEQGVSERERLAMLPDNASTIIQEWMVERPCPYVSANRDKELIRILSVVKATGTPVIVYSDYPVKEKLSAMGFNPDMAFCSEDLGSLKPDPKGLRRILGENHITPERCLVIGDREEKDGALAHGLGSDALILPGVHAERQKLYRRAGKGDTG